MSLLAATLCCFGCFFGVCNLRYAKRQTFSSQKHGTRNAVSGIVSIDNAVLIDVLVAVVVVVVVVALLAVVSVSVMVMAVSMRRSVF